MGNGDMVLPWNSESVAKIMRDNAIRTRGQLACRLEPLGISRVMVYRLFTEEWTGEATIAMLTTLAREFRVGLTQLVLEPFVDKEEANDRHPGTPRPGTAPVAGLRRGVRPLQHRVRDAGVENAV